MSPRGNPFVCWLSSEGYYHDVALHIGDEVEFHSLALEKWVLGRIGRKMGAEGFGYVARWKGHEETVWMITQLRPIS